MWTCSRCGETHDGLATVFGPEAPTAWLAASDEQRSRGELTPDQCVLPAGDTTHHFIRGHIEVPIVDRDAETFVWSVWCSLSEDSMRTTVEHWDDVTRGDLPPMFGWLDSQLPYDQDTLGLATQVHTRAPGVVPLVEPDPGADHPLVREHRDGMTWHRVAEINEILTGGRS